MTLVYAPPPIKVTPPPSYVPSPAPLNKVAQSAQARQAQVAGLGAPIRVVFGEDRIGAQIAAHPVVYGGKWILLCQWCYGEIEAVLDIEINGQPPPTGTVITTYLGAAGQTVDPVMVAAYAAQTPPQIYADALPGMASSVVQVPFNTTAGFPVVTALIKGLKLFDPRTNATEYLTTPALALARYLSDPVWGEGKPVTGAGDVASLNENLIGGAEEGSLVEQHRTIGLVLDTRQPAEAWRETLRLYAGCLIIPEGDGYRLVPDAPAEVAMSFDVGGAANNIIQLGEITIAGKTKLPTAIRVQYTDPTTWEDAWTEYVVRPGATEWRPLDVPLPGVQRLSQALREATEMLNKLWLGDVSMPIYTTDIGLRALPGSVIEITDPRGASAKQMRVLGVSGERGRLRLDTVEYDPAMYCLTVVENPTTPDTNLPQPAAPPTPTGLAVVERNFTMRDGAVSTRFEASWDAADFPHPMQYLVIVRAGGVDVYSSFVTAASYVSGPLQEGLAYSVSVAVVSTAVGKTGVSVNWGGVAQGNLIPPPVVTKLRAYEVGGESFISHDAVVDKGWTSTEYRIAAYNASHDADWHWALGQIVDMNPAPSIRYQTKEIPAGTWMLTAKGHDSARTNQFKHGQESVNAVGVVLVVTSDANAFLVDHYQFAAANATNMLLHHHPLPTDNEWVSSNGATWNAMFPGGMDTYTNPIPTYCQPASSELKTEVVDFGYPITGNWRAICLVYDIAGTASIYIGLSATGAAGTFTEYPDGSCKATGRFAYVRLCTTGSMWVDEYPSLRVDAVGVRKVYQVTTSASGPVTVTMDGHYLKLLEASPTSMGSAPNIPKAENFTLSATADNTFEVRSIDPQTYNLVVDTVQVVIVAIKAD